MEVFHLGQKVEVKKGYLPSDDLLPPSQQYFIIGTRRRINVSGPHTEFLVLFPIELKAHGWNLLDNMALLERERYSISKDDWAPDSYVYWVPEVGVKHPEKITKADGAQCLKCKDFVYMASSTGGFTCRSCILDPYRCSPPSWTGDE